MKKLLLISGVCLLLSSCGRQFDSSANFEWVQHRYNNSYVMTVPDKKYEFLIVTDTSVVWVEMYGSDSVPSAEIILKKLKPCSTNEQH